MLLTLTISAEEITTNNLLDKNFDAGSWSGSADGRHGSNVIAAEHDTYIQSNDISVKNDAGLTELQMQNGFTTNHQFEYWHWNTYESNVKSTVTITGANGETTTQIRNYASDSCGSNNCGSFSVGSDTNIVLRNVQTDYDLSVRYDFTDSSNATNSHYGVDLKEPSLTLTYESQPVELEVQNTIQDLFEDFKIEKDLKFEEKFKMVEFKEEPMVMKIKEEPIIEEFFEIMSIPQDKPKMKEPKEIIEQPIMAEKPKEEITTDQLIANAKKEEMPKETIEEEIVEEDEKFTKVNSEISQKEKSEETKKEVATEEPKEKIKTKIASTKTNKKKLKIHEVMANVDAQVKDISKNLIIKNIIKLDAMQENQASLLVYNNAEFYQSKDIYLQQLDIFDNRDIYVTVNLTKYIDNDIMQVKIKKLNDIQYKKRMLLLELQELKNG
tara:strand:- start:1124 stop:2440 length:1317 start_codon:yes stop_codon:yes gene_type:complete